MTLRTTTLIVLLAAAPLMLAGCEGGQYQEPPTVKRGNTPQPIPKSEVETVFSDGGLFGSSKAGPNADSGGSGMLGVNSYLWRATLDTVSFLPVTSADPFGGVIITDWYAPPETPNERFKLNVYVLGRALRADGINVSVFRQVLDAQGNWRDAQVQDDTARQLEDAILTRARQLRNETRMLNN